MKRKALCVLLVLALIVSTLISLPVSAAETISSIEIGPKADKQFDFSASYTGKVKISFTLNVTPDSSRNTNVNFYLYPKGGDRTSAQAVIQLSGTQFFAQQEHATDHRITFSQDCKVVFEYDLTTSQYTVSVNGKAPAGPFRAWGTQANVGGIAMKDNMNSTTLVKNLTVETVGAGGGETPPAGSSILSVGPNGEYETLAQALTDAKPGDVIEIDAAGDYLGAASNARIDVENLTIRGVNGRAKLGYADRSGSVPVTAKKGIWVVGAKDLTVENLEFQNAHDVGEMDGRNYYGIRLDPVEDSKVVIKGCYFHGNDGGVLVGAVKGMTVEMENCEFDDAGFGVRQVGEDAGTNEFYAHNIYMGRIESFTLKNSIARHIKSESTLVKSRASNSYILSNYIADEETSEKYLSNSNIDIPNAGNLYVIGNVIQKGAVQGNSRVILYGEDTDSNPGRNIVFANNTIVNEWDAPVPTRSMIQLWTSGGKTYSTDHVLFLNNFYQGELLNGQVYAVATVTDGVSADVTKTFFTTANGNFLYDLSKAAKDASYAAANDPKFVDPEHFDYRLQTSSPLIDKGVQHADVNGVSVVPQYQVNMDVVNGTRGTASTKAIGTVRSIHGSAIDVGAFETVTANVYQVGPNRTYKTLNSVKNLLKPGDVVEVDGGYDYKERVTFNISGTADAPITIRGVGEEKPNFCPIVDHEVSGIIEVHASHFVLENLKLTGDVYRDKNDPDWGNTSHDGKAEDGMLFRGVYNGGDDITIRNCDISHCAQGVQSNGSAAGDLLIEYCDIHENGRGWGEHNLYIGTNHEKYPDATLTFQYNYIHDNNCDANGLKSRALNNRVYFNWFENNTQEMELISAGVDEATLRKYESNNDVVGNVFVKTMEGRFIGQLCRFGGDGTGAGSYGRYRFANNTFALLRKDNDGSAFNAIRLNMGIESVELYNNIFYAAYGSIRTVRDSSPKWASGQRLVYGSNNWVTKGSTVPSEWTNTIEGTDPGFVDVSKMDFHLAEGSPLIDAGSSNTVKIWSNWSYNGYTNKNNRIADPMTAVKEPIHKNVILDSATTVPTNVDRIDPDAIDIGAYGSVAVSLFDPKDVNRDEKIDYGDVAEALKYFNWSADADYTDFTCSCGDFCFHESDGVTGLDWNDAVHADVNKDGAIDILDILLILSEIQ